MSNCAEKRRKQLGIPYGTAASKLRRMLLFHLAKKCRMNICIRCSKKIQTYDDFTIDHIHPWYNRDAKLFWDMRNIGFSHAECNKPHTYNGPNKISLPKGKAFCGRCKRFKPVSSFGKRVLKTKKRSRNICNNCRRKRGWDHANRIRTGSSAG